MCTLLSIGHGMRPRWLNTPTTGDLLTLVDDSVHDTIDVAACAMAIT